jgi:hypothetical protein
MQQHGDFSKPYTELFERTCTRIHWTTGYFAHFASHSPCHSWRSRAAAVVHMSQSTPRYTPQQLLEAGQTAEAAGRAEHAVQFYMHLTDHYAHTAESLAARDGLSRIAMATGKKGGPGVDAWRAPIGIAPGPAPLPPGVGRAPPAAPPVRPATVGAPMPSAPPANNVAQQPVGRPMPPSATGRGPVSAAAPSPIAQPPSNGQPLGFVGAAKDGPPAKRKRRAEASPGDSPETPVSPYRKGRRLALIVNVLGWLAIGLGIVLAVLAAVGFGWLIPGLGRGSTIGMGIGIGGMVAIGGLMMLLRAEAARAAFDVAEAGKQSER